LYAITPGETEAEDARTITDQLSDGLSSDSSLDGGSIVFRMDTDHFALLGIVSLELPNGRLVRAMGISAAGANNLGRLGDLMATGLQPTQVYRTCDITIPLIFVAFGQDTRVIAEMPLGKRLRPETPITFMRVYADGRDALAESLLSFGCAVELGWHGFAPRRVYLELPRI
jgi:hypothetical protein